MFILYPIYALLSFTLSILSLLLLNWIVVLFVDSKGNLPKWLSYFQTFDSPLPSGYLNGVMWLNRNPTYGFDLYVFGTAWKAQDWKVRYVSFTSTRSIFFATSATGAFNFFYEGKAGSFKFGWKAWNCYDRPSGTFSHTFGDGKSIPVAFTFNPFKSVAV